MRVKGKVGEGLFLSSILVYWLWTWRCETLSSAFHCPSAYKQADTLSKVLESSYWGFWTAKDAVTDWPVGGTWIKTQQFSDLSPELLILLSDSLPPRCLPLANPVLFICFPLSKLLQRPAMLTITKTSWHSLIGRPRFRKAAELMVATERLLGQHRA